MRTIYSPHEYYQRALESMKRTDHEVVEPQQYNLIGSFTALVRVLVKLGLFDSKRIDFWRFITHALLKDKARIAETLRLAAMGYHCRQLNQLYSEPT